MAGNRNVLPDGVVPATNSRVYYGYYIILASLLISIMMWGSRQSFGVFFAPLLDEFGWQRGPTSAAFSITWIGTGILSIFVGRLNDRFGPRVIITIAGCFLGLGYFLMSTLDNIWQLFLYYGVINIGMSAALIPIMSTIARWFVKMRAFMTGIVLAGTGVALIVVVPLSNQLIASYGWRTSYSIVGGAAFIIIVICSQFLKRDPSKIGKAPYGYDPAKQATTGLAVSGLNIKEAACTRQLYQLAAVYFCAYFLFYLIIAHGVLYATGNGIPQNQAVIIISVLGVAGIAGRILMGVLADKIGHKPVMVLGGALVMIAFILLLTSNELEMMYVYAAIFGFGHGGLATMESPMTAQIFGMRSHGTILGMVFTGDTLGGALGPVMAGYVFDKVQSYTLVFQICVLITVINLILILFLRPIKKMGEIKST